MSDTEEIHTNPAGGKQSKLYRAYHLIDPYALEILAAVHHRGSIKYAPDNWRKIDTEEHLNHCLHHITQAMKWTLGKRLGSVCKAEPEDHLGHALCRLTFAVAMEAQNNGNYIHPEHSSTAYHEPKTPSIKRNIVREVRPNIGPIPATPGFNEAAGSFAAFASSARRNNSLRPSKGGSSKSPGSNKPSLSSHHRR